MSMSDPDVQVVAVNVPTDGDDLFRHDSAILTPVGDWIGALYDNTVEGGAFKLLVKTSHRSGPRTMTWLLRDLYFIRGDITWPKAMQGYRYEVLDIVALPDGHDYVTIIESVRVWDQLPDEHARFLSDWREANPGQDILGRCTSIVVDPDGPKTYLGMRLLRCERAQHAGYAGQGLHGTAFCEGRERVTWQ